MYEKDAPQRGAYPDGTCAGGALGFLGIWVGTGSRHERGGRTGRPISSSTCSSKGTRSRTAAQLAEEMDAVGGPDQRLHHQGVHLLLCPGAGHPPGPGGGHPVRHVLPLPVRRRRRGDRAGVILEEIGMYEDNPEDLCAERLAGAVFKGSPLARPILGRRPPWTRWTGRGLRAYQRAHYGPTASWWPGGSLPMPTPWSWPGFAGLEARPPHRCEGRRLCARGGGEEEGHRAEPPDPWLSPGLSFADPGGSSSSCPPSWGACPPACSSRCGSRRGFATPSTPTALP